MHYFDKSRNLFGGHGIVGGQIGLGAGIAFADWYRGEDHVTLCMFGDGAARQGILHETFNMTMTWKLRHLHHREQPVRHGHQRGPHQQRA